MSAAILQGKQSSKVSLSQLGVLTCILLVGAVLRIAPLTENRLHPDEALFATLGRLIISGKDPWLNQTHLLVDKPPVFYYAIASGISVSWASEMAARLPDLFASVISLALIARLASYLWQGELATVLSTLVFALSPFGIAFAPTVFADPQMTMWILAALVALSARRWGIAGMLYGLALATKQNALFFAPLIVGFAIIRTVSHASRTQLLQRTVKFGMGVALLVVAMFLWDANRQAPVGFWTAGIEFNNPHRLIRSAEIFPRLRAWWFSARYLVSAPAMTVACFLALIGQTFLDLKSVRQVAEPESISAIALITFSTGYLTLCWLVAFPLFDRYLLPILPIMALLIGRMLGKAAQYAYMMKRRKHSRILAGATILLIMLMHSPAFSAASGRVAVGGDHGTYDGIYEIAGYMSHQPSGTVLYYNSLGWSLHYYMFDSEIYLAPFDSPVAIEDDLLRFGAGNEQRYIVLPGWQSRSEILAAITRAGYSCVPLLETKNRVGQTSFFLYRIIPDL